MSGTLPPKKKVTKKKTSARLRRMSPLLRRRKKVDITSREDLERVMESVERAQHIAELSEKIRLKLAAVPGLFDDVAELLHMASNGEVGQLRDVLNLPMTQERCTEMGQGLMEMFMEVGREEIRKAHAMEELAAVARGWAENENENENEDLIDSDFEEA